VFGRSLQKLSSIRSDLGVCPQHDVLWPELTVNEHLYLFAALKGVPPTSVESEAARSLELVGLTEKALVRVAALSGGQKRKLSVALAFLGGSKVVFLDEPTSGMDPYSRRSTWNILQNARAGRIIILTTHFMDEADLLGDRIAIMSDGRVKCCGGPLFLKEQYGVGYTMTVIRDGMDSSVVDIVREHVPSVTVATTAGAELALRLPIDASPAFAGLLRDLMGARGIAAGVRDVGVGVTSVEDVFMRVSAGESDDAKSYGATIPAILGGSNSTAKASLDDVRRAARANLSTLDAFGIQTRAIFLKRARYARRDVRAVCCLLLVPIVALVGGLGALLRSAWGDIPALRLSPAMFNNNGNRGISGVPQFPNYVNVFAYKSGLGMASPGLVELTNALPSPDATTSGLIVPTAAAAAALDATNFSGFITSPDFPLRDWQRMSSLLLSTAPTRAASVYGSYVITGTNTILPSQDGSATINASNPYDAPLTYAAFVNSTAVHGGPIFTNLMATASLRMIRSSNPSVSITSHPLPLTAYQKANLLVTKSFTVVQVVMLALAFVSPAFMNFVVRERESSAKHQQLISGVSIPAYWVANLAFDISTFIVPAFLALVTLKAFNAGPIITMETSNAAAVVVLLIAYGFAGTTSTYAFSHIFTSPASASAASVMLNILLFAGVLACFVLQGIQSTCKAVPIVRGLLNLLPFFAFGSGLSNVASIKVLPKNLALCDLKPGSFPVFSEFTTAFDMKVAGGPILYLFGTSIVYLVIAIAVDYARNDMALGLRVRSLSRAVFGGGDYDEPSAAPSHTVDSAVAAEAARVVNVLRSSTNSDAIIMSRMRKVFPATSSFLGCFGTTNAKKIAVADVSFGVSPGEIFGFLGINGAGKTTTLKMLTGDELPSSGRALLGGYDILHEQQNVRRLIGCASGAACGSVLYPGLTSPHPVFPYLVDCPQFDALLDLLTSREHLELYARIKGIPLGDLKDVVDDKLREFDLVPFANKLAGRLSGGNKRKLSVAIALIGNPSILFLDEMSTGVDPVAKRFMWRIISSVATTRKQCAVMLTSHSMEEVTALSTRIGIMVGGRLRCLGSSQELRTAHGAGFSVELRLPPSRGNPADAEAALNVAASAAEATVFASPSFRGARLIERQGNLLKFRAPRGPALADMFEAVEAIRSSLGAGTTMTIGETSLEEIFNAIAATQEEEGAAPGLETNPHFRGPATL
jgi:ATP-binding cassette subfamily A (ABC1) protein 1